MVRFWGREVMGWLLVLIGLGCFYLLTVILLNPGPSILLDGPFFMTMGIVVFRGGIHLLKVAVAARVCLQTQVEVRKAPAPPEVRRKRTEAPLDW